MGPRTLWRFWRENRTFALYANGVLISRSGDKFYLIAMAWFFLAHGRAADLGLFMAASGIPRMLLGPRIGSALDTKDPRTLLILDNLGRSLVVMVIAAAVSNNAQTLLLVALAVVLGVMATISEVGEHVVAPALVSEEQLPLANANLSANWQFAGLVAPIVGGWMVGSLGASWALAVDALTFILMAAAAAALPRHLGRVRARHSEEQKGRIAPIWRAPDFVPLTIIGLLVLLQGGFWQVLLPIVARDNLSGEPMAYSALLTAGGVGSLIGISLLTDRAVSHKFSYPLVIAVGALSAPMGYLGNTLVAVVWLAFISFLEAPYFVLDRTLMQKRFAGPHLGRAIGARSSVTSAGYPLGSAAAGLMVEWRGITLPIIACSLMALLAAALALPLANRRGEST